jgi:small subunit ribosomal protein S17
MAEDETEIEGATEEAQASPAGEETQAPEAPAEAPVEPAAEPAAEATEAEPAAEAAAAEPVASETEPTPAETTPAETTPAEPAAAEPAVEADSGSNADTGAQVAETAAPSAGSVVTPAVEPAPRRTKRKRLPRALRHKHSKPARERPGTPAPIARTPKPERELGRRQERRGVVVSDKGDKSIVVKVETTQAHPRYKKVVRRSRRLHAHDELNAATVGDMVRIVESRPLSRTKHWRLVEIVQKAR